ncbi:MAG: hypothetical protein KGP28_00405 [Bdellovibrionales bacterium]|nr:hypothetical protein [Bdellovibrionales bacterium]
MNRLVKHLALFGLLLAGFGAGAAVAQDLPQCYVQGSGGSPLNVGLAVGDLCSSDDGKVYKKLACTIPEGTSRSIFDFKKCLRRATKKEIESVAGSAQSTATTHVATTSKSSAEDADAECVECNRSCSSRISEVSKNKGGTIYCMGDSGPSIMGMGPGGPMIQPIAFPGRNPDLVFCGSSKPVKKRGITLCGCDELIDSKLVTNPLLTDGAYCIRGDDFFIAEKCKESFDGIHIAQKTVDEKIVALEKTQNLLDLCLERKDRESRDRRGQRQKYPQKSENCEALEKQMDRLEVELVEARAVLELQLGKGFEPVSCEFKKAEKEDLRRIKWVQKNQRYKLKKNGAVPAPGGLGMPMPIQEGSTMNSDDGPIRYPGEIKQYPADNRSKSADQNR